MSFYFPVAFLGLGYLPALRGTYTDMSMTQVHGSAEDMGEVISFLFTIYIPFYNYFIT